MVFLLHATKKAKLCGITLLLAATLLILLFLLYPREQSINSLMRKIYALPTNTTIQSLEQKGYLNLIDIQSKRISDIHAFLQGEATSRPTILKTVTASMDGPHIRVFYRPEQSSIVYMTTYDVVRQVVYTSNSTYYKHTYKVCKDNCVTEVWLEPHNDYEPYLLYSYYYK